MCGCAVDVNHAALRGFRGNLQFRRSSQPQAREREPDPMTTHIAKLWLTRWRSTARVKVMGRVVGPIAHRLLVRLAQTAFRMKHPVGCRRHAAGPDVGACGGQHGGGDAGVASRSRGPRGEVHRRPRLAHIAEDEPGERRGLGIPRQRGSMGMVYLAPFSKCQLVLGLCLSEGSC